jgi:hypothetical protein
VHEPEAVAIELEDVNVVGKASQSPNLNHIPGGNIATAYFRPQLPPELEFDTDRIILAYYLRQ